MFAINIKWKRFHWITSYLLFKIQTRALSIYGYYINVYEFACMYVYITYMYICVFVCYFIIVYSTNM
jgi:hypothetical protein